MLDSNPWSKLSLKAAPNYRGLYLPQAFKGLSKLDPIIEA
jgi:hypothetical protein